MTDKKLRTTVVQFPNDPKYHGSTIRFDLTKGELFAFHDEKYPIPLKGMVRTIQHARELKSPKILSSLSAPKDVMRPDDFGFLSQFDKIFFIDTNSIPGSGLSIAAFFQLQVIEFSEEYFIDVHQQLGFFEFKNIKADFSPEIVGWYTLFEQGWFRELIKNNRIGIVTDGHLGEIEDFNNRIKPIIDECFIPENVTLIYASADKQDSFLNRLMKCTDQQAASLMGQINSGLAIEFPFNKHRCCEQFRLFFKDGVKIIPNYFKKEGYTVGPNAEMRLYGVRVDNGERELIQQIKLK